MYAPPPAVVPVANRGRAGGLAAGPLLAICCLGTILFLIAATIVLALIPVYLPTKKATAGTSPNYYASGVPNPTISTNGALSANDRNAIARAIEKAAGLPANSAAVSSASTANAQSGGKRRRRGFGLQRERRQISFFQLLLLIFFFDIALCERCHSSAYILGLSPLAITVILDEGLITITINFSISPINYTPAGSVTTTSASATAATPAVGG